MTPPFAFLCLCLLICSQGLLQRSKWQKPAITCTTQRRISIYNALRTAQEQPSTSSLQTVESNDAFDAASQFNDVAKFLLRAGIIGTCTGLSVVVFKTAISSTSYLFYEQLADLLPKPSFYWPLALYPIIGSTVVSLLAYIKGDDIRQGVDFIARSIDATDTSHDSKSFQLHDLNAKNKLLLPYVLNESEVETQLLPPSEQLLRQTLDPSIETPVGMSTMSSDDSAQIDISNIGVKSSAVNRELIAHVVSSETKTPDLSTRQFNPVNQVLRLCGAVATLGCGCSLGPEGPAVEIGAGWARIISSVSAFSMSAKERHHLFLAGTAAGVAAGFNAPIAGVFFALECGNRYLKQNTVKLDETAPDGPRADIAAIVTAAALADIVVGLGLHEKSALSIQGNSYAMVSPFFELPLYMVLGLLCGAISVVFTKARDFFTNLFLSSRENLPAYLHPMVGGLMCGVAAVFFPQTLFVGYATLDQLLAGKIQLGFPLLTQLLGLKVLLAAFALGSGLIGGVFAPSLFFGATAGTAFHAVLGASINFLQHLAAKPHILPESLIAFVTNAAAIPDTDVASHPAISDALFFSLATAPAYATVGAAATLGALFRAPLTSSMLMFELTQNHDIVLPVLVSSGIAGLFAELLNHPRRLW